MKEQYTAEMATAAAERGAAWLDEQCPEWVREIDLEQLDLGSTYCCMLGQTADCIVGKGGADAGYWRVLSRQSREVDAQDAWAEEHGFKVSNASDARYEMLTIAWREYIRQRLEAAVS